MQDYPVSEQLIRYAHKLCPDDQLMVHQNAVDKNRIGLVMPSSSGLMVEAGFDITDKFTDNIETMFNLKSLELANRLIGAQLKKYWSLCLSELGEYKPDLINRNLLLEGGIDYSWSEDSNAEYKVQDIKRCLEGNILLVGEVMGLYHDYLIAKEGEPHLWAHYKINLSRKVEDMLCDFYLPKLKTKSKDEEDVRYGLRVALITYRPKKGSFLTYASDIVKKILPIMAKGREIDAAYPNVSQIEDAKQLIKEHNLPPEFAEKVIESAEKPLKQPYKEPHSDSLDLCRTLYQFEKVPVPIGYEANNADLKKALTGLQGGDRLFMIMYYFEELNWKEMECVFELPKDLLQQIHSALIKKIRRELANFD